MRFGHRFSATGRRTQRAFCRSCRDDCLFIAQSGLHRPSIWTIVPAGVVSSALPHCAVRTIGCVFHEAKLIRGRRTKQGARLPRASWTAHRTLAEPSILPAGASGHTRIRPPRDIVKLEDRLRLLLQPPLESLLAAQALRFAFPPFGYQLDGVAFLYPRHEAVLADEMGLGKTMQAITAVRLLVHHGYLRRVLLVCPKPLVTNWQREFALWAPEIAGQRHRRRPDAAAMAVAAGQRPGDHCQLRSTAARSDRMSATRITTTTWSCSTKRSASKTPRARPTRLCGRFPAAAAGRSPARRSRTASTIWSGFSNSSRPGQLNAEMKPRTIGRAVSDHVLRRTKDQVLTDLPPKLFRDAEVELTPEQAESYRLAEDEGVVRLRADEARADDSARVRAGAAAEADLQLRSGHRRQQQTGAAGGRFGGMRRQRPQGDRVQPMGRNARGAAIAAARFGPAEYHGKIPHRRRDAVIEHFRDDPTAT